MDILSQQLLMGTKILESSLRKARTVERAERLLRRCLREVADLDNSATREELRDAFDAVTEGAFRQPADALSELLDGGAWVTHIRSSGERVAPRVLFTRKHLLASAPWKALMTDLQQDASAARVFRVDGQRAPWVMLRKQPAERAAGHPRIKIPPRDDTTTDPVWLMPWPVFLAEYVSDEYTLDKVDKETEDDDSTEEDTD